MTQQSNKPKRWRWTVTLVPVDDDEKATINWRHTVFMIDAKSEEERKRFYEALLEIEWLARDVRNAVMWALGRSPQKAQKDYRDGRTIALQHRVDELTFKDEQGRPVRGSKTFSMKEVAEYAGITDVDTLKRRFTRLKGKQRNQKQRT